MKQIYFIVSAILFTLLVAGALFAWEKKQTSVEPAPVLPIQPTPVIPTPIQPTLHTNQIIPTPTTPYQKPAGWKTYRNEEFTLKFDYPAEWGEIKLRYKENGNYDFSTDEKLVGGFILNKNTGNLFFTKINREFNFSGDTDNKIGRETLLHMISLDRNIKTLYRQEGIISISAVSPKGDYIAFNTNGDNFHQNSYILEISNGKNILTSHSDIYETNGIFWSSDGQYMVINSVYNKNSNKGVDAVFLSGKGDFNNLNPIYYIKKATEKTEVYGRFLDSRFLDDQILEIIDNSSPHNGKKTIYYDLLSRTFKQLPDGVRLYKNDLYNFSFEYPKTLPELKKESVEAITQNFIVSNRSVINKTYTIKPLIRFSSHSLNDGSLNVSIFPLVDYYYSCPPGGISFIYDAETGNWWDTDNRKIDNKAIKDIDLHGIKGYEIGCGDVMWVGYANLLIIPEKNIMILINSDINADIGQNGKAFDLVRSTFKYNKS